MSRTIRLTLAAAALLAVAAPLSASAEPDIDPVCRMHWEKPTVQYDENGLPHTVTVERPYWVC